LNPGNVGSTREPYEAAARANGVAPGAAKAADTRRVWTPAERVAVWRVEGPLIHEATGIARLDELTGGGPVYGSRWYVLGAPDACKTALIVQCADEWVRRGIVVGLLAVDEEADDITTRLAQRAKFRRAECEEREPRILSEMEAALATCSIRLYGPEWTVEEAAGDLVRDAASRGERRQVLFVDSVQTVTCNAMLEAEREMSERQIVTANVRAIRDVATRCRMLVMATSEMNRNAYRNVEAAEQSNDMAAGKESGAIEYGARVMLSFRSVRDHGELVEVRATKNKHGPSYPAVDAFYLAINRARQTLEEAEAPVKDDGLSNGSAKKAAKKAEQVTAAARVAEYLARNQGHGTREIRSGLRLALGTCSDDLADDAVKLLEGAGAVIAPPFERGKPRPHTLDGSKVPPEVLAEVATDHRAEVIAARPPTPSPARRASRSKTREP
jgi:KaiC/GvpD/RAD55 family RecA-like ATPase